MAKWTVSKFFSFVAFITMMILFFFWVVSQVSDLGIFFGFRTSHTISNDIANVITSVGGVPGKVSADYSIDSGSGSKFNYNLLISNKVVCVDSYISGRGTFTTDCASHPYNLEKSVDLEDIKCITLRVNKEAAIDEEGPTISIEEVSRNCQ